MENIYLQNTKENSTKIKNQLVESKYEKIFKTTITKVDGCQLSNLEEEIIGEYPLCFILNDKYMNTFLCTPEKLEELLIGFLATKGYISNRDDILELSIDEENRVAYAKINLKGDLKKESFEYEENVFLNQFDYVKCTPVKNNNITIDQESIYKLMKRNLTYSKMFKDTGGVHCIAIFDKENDIVICEDVARHNAMDKAIGYSILNNIDLKDKVIFVSGRISLEMILKAATMQIPIIISKSAPTNLSVELAKKLNITLVGFVRGERMNIYTNQHRININVKGGGI